MTLKFESKKKVNQDKLLQIASENGGLIDTSILLSTPFYIQSSYNWLPDSST